MTSGALNVSVSYWYEHKISSPYKLLFGDQTMVQIWTAEHIFKIIFITVSLSSFIEKKLFFYNWVLLKLGQPARVNTFENLFVSKYVL